MKKFFFVSFVGILLGAGCNTPVSQEQNQAPSLPLAVVTSLVVLPLDGNIASYNPTYKRFGEYFEDRFLGYHVGEDSEVVPEDEAQEVPIRAIATGTLRFLDSVSGYGGVMVIAHDIEGEIINAIYGHIDIGSTKLQVGDTVMTGEFLAHLGDNKSKETDGERQHLHFALYKGDEIQIQGYEKNARNLQNWINPQDFFMTHRVDLNNTGWQSSYNLIEPSGKNIFKLELLLPKNWDIEYIPSLQALNLYMVSGNGTARERSQVFIRYFDANKFLTLSSVDVLSTKDVQVGAQSYTGKQYEIEKKSGIADFTDQPSWRNKQHRVTDFRDKEGFTRYYVVAKNPNLDMETYQKVLESMTIVP